MIRKTLLKICLYVTLASAAFPQSPIISYADAVVPQMPVGCGFTSTIILVNPSPNDIGFTMKFWRHDGKERTVPIEGETAARPSVTGIVKGNGAFSLASKPSTLAAPDCNGWAEVNSEDTLGGYVVLSQNGGNQTTVPFASRFSSRFLVPFDVSTEITTSIALVNPSFENPASYTITFRDQAGRLLCTEKAVDPLGKGEQKAFELDAVRLPTCWEDVAKAQQGVAEFYTPNLELSGFALRFRRAQGFVSFPALTPLGK
jgi:hypothetical protein